MAGSLSMECFSRPSSGDQLAYIFLLCYDLVSLALVATSLEEVPFFLIILLQACLHPAQVPTSCL